MISWLHIYINRQWICHVWQQYMLRTAEHWTYYPVERINDPNYCNQLWSLLIRAQEARHCTPPCCRHPNGAPWEESTRSHQCLPLNHWKAVQACRWIFCADNSTLGAKADETCLVITEGQWRGGKGKWSVTKPTLALNIVLLVTKEKWMSSRLSVHYERPLT